MWFFWKWDNILTNCRSDLTPSRKNSAVSTSTKSSKARFVMSSFQWRFSSTNPRRFEMSFLNCPYLSNIYFLAFITIEHFYITHDSYILLISLKINWTYSVLSLFFRSLLIFEILAHFRTAKEFFCKFSKESGLLIFFINRL